MNSQHPSLPEDAGQPKGTDVQALLDFSLDVICSFDGGGKFLSLTRAVRDLLGYEPGELIGRRYSEFIHPDDAEKTATAVTSLINGHKLTNFENRYIRKDGTVVTLLWSASWDAERKSIYGIAKDATQLVAERNKTKTYEQRLLRAYKLARIAWWERNVQENTIVISDELYNIYGLNKDTHPVFTTDMFMSLVYPDDLPKVKAAMVRNGQQAFNTCEHRLVKPSGELIHVIHYMQSIRDSKGTVVQVHGTTKDITERKTAVLKIKSTKRTLKKILNSISDGFFAVNKEWRVTYWNAKAEELLHRKKENILGKNIWEEFSDAVSLKFYTEYHRAMKEQVPVQFEEYFPPLSLWFEVSAYPSKDVLAVYFRNVTERKQQELALTESNRRYQYITKATSDATWDWNIEANLLYWGEGFASCFGYTYTGDNIPIEQWLQQIHPDDHDRVAASFYQVVNGHEEYWREEYRFRKADGTYVDVIDKGFVLRADDGKAVRMVGAMQDVTQRNEAERLLKLSEERYRLLFSQSLKPKWMFSAADWQIVEVNDAALRLYGYTREEFLRLKILDLKAQPDTEELNLLQLQNVTSYHNVVQHVKKNGESFYIEITSHAIELPTGRHFIVDGDDMTEKLALQQRLITERVNVQKRIGEAVLNAQERERGEIGRELHDNVNQILTSAKLYQELALGGMENPEQLIRKSADLILAAINENRKLSKRLSAPTLGNIRLTDSVQELIEMVQSTNTFRVTLDIDVIEGLEIEQDMHLAIYRILQEHLTNIQKYAEATSVQVFFDIVDDDLVLKVTDNGKGFSVNQKREGIGISNMTMRAESFGGSLIINSAPGLGCVLIVRIPLP